MELQVVIQNGENTDHGGETFAAGGSRGCYTGVH
jgi:hypothetical protein